MHSLTPTLKLALLCLLAVALAGCGGLSSGLTTAGVPVHDYGSFITAADPITVVFLRQLDGSTLTGNIAVTADGAAQQFTVSLQDDSYRLIILPSSGWPAGTQLVVKLTGGLGGIHYTDGRTFDTIELVYHVGQQ